MGEVINFPIKNRKSIDNNLFQRKMLYNELLNNFENFFEEFINLLRDIIDIDEFDEKDNQQIIYINHCVEGLLASICGFNHPYMHEGELNLKENNNDDSD